MRIPWPHAMTISLLYYVCALGLILLCRFSMLALCDCILYNSWSQWAELRPAESCLSSSWNWSSKWDGGHKSSTSSSALNSSDWSGSLGMWKNLAIANMLVKMSDLNIMRQPVKDLSTSTKPLGSSVVSDSTNFHQMPRQEMSDFSLCGAKDMHRHVCMHMYIHTCTHKQTHTYTQSKQKGTGCLMPGPYFSQVPKTAYHIFPTLQFTEMPSNTFEMCRLSQILTKTATATATTERKQNTNPEKPLCLYPACLAITNAIRTEWLYVLIHTSYSS